MSENVEFIGDSMVCENIKEKDVMPKDTVPPKPKNIINYESQDLANHKKDKQSIRSSVNEEINYSKAKKQNTYNDNLNEDNFNELDEAFNNLRNQYSEKEIEQLIKKYSKQSN